VADKVTSWFNNLSKDQKKPLDELRQMILASNTNIEEQFKWSRPCYSINSLVCYLHKSAGHVTIGFQQGSHLEDSDGLLEGEGKDMRHIKIRFGEKIDSVGIKRLIKSAIKFDKR